MVAKAVGNVFAVLLIVGAPVLSFTTARNPNIRLVPRHVLYLSAVISQWLLAAAYVAVVRLTSMDPVFFRAVPASAFIRWTLLVVSVSLGGLFILLLLERRGWWPPESDLVYLLLPSSRM
jgi:preprotein translocase subunit Sec61beta